MRRLFIPILLLFLASIAHAASTPEESLKLKGLSKVGTTWLLDGDIKLPDKLRQMRAAKSRVDENAARRTKLEQDIDSATTTVVQTTHDLAEQDALLARSRKEPVWRRLAILGKRNELAATNLEALQFIDARHKELARLDDPSDQYINAVKEVAAHMENVAREYEKLAADQDVSDAITAINARGGLKTRLGPSPQFATQLPEIRKARERVREGIIKLTLIAGTPHANVTINGILNVLMTVDTGASAVTLSADSAKKLGIKYDSHNPTVKMHTADGKVTDAKVVMLESVKLGQSTVENVECLVLPAKVEGSDLLGATFLRNFVCKLDLPARELHLTQVSGGNEGPAKVPANPLANLKNPASVTVNVNAADDWTEVITVKKGDVLAISATGTWSFGREKRQEVGPAGNQRLGFLEGKLGQSTFRINEALTITAAADGVLYMRMNDTLRTDNSGSLSVTVAKKN